VEKATASTTLWLLLAECLEIIDAEAANAAGLTPIHIVRSPVVVAVHTGEDGRAKRGVRTLQGAHCRIGDRHVVRDSEVGRDAGTHKWSWAHLSLNRCQQCHRYWYLCMLLAQHHGT
jgi:hypothetical protein